MIDGRIKPTKEQAAECIPDVLEKESIHKPIKKEKKITFIRDVPTGIFNIK